MSLYKGCKTAVQISVHQVSAWSPLLFIIIMNFLTEDGRDCSLMELLYADNLLFYGESLNEIMDKYGRWKMQWEQRVRGCVSVKQRHPVII